MFISVSSLGFITQESKIFFSIIFHLFNSILSAENRLFWSALLFLKKQRKKLSYVTLHRKQKTFHIVFSDGALVSHHESEHLQGQA